MKSFEGKTVLITGASSGIGRLFAEKIAAQKANLLITARREESLRALAGELSAKYGVAVKYLRCDLSRADAPWQIHDWTRSLGVEVDVLINNAGFGAYGRFDSMSLENLQSMMQVNMQALVLLTRLYITQLKSKKGGIIQIASTAAFQPLPFLALYAATKAFVKSFSEAIWAENPEVRVFCLCPGNTESEFHDAAGIHQKKVFFRATAETLVDYGIRKFLKTDAPTRIHGWQNTLLAFSNRLMPGRLGLWFARKIFEMRIDQNTAAKL